MEAVFFVIFLHFLSRFYTYDIYRQYGGVNNERYTDTDPQKRLSF